MKEPSHPGDESTPLSLDDPAWVDSVMSDAVDEVGGVPATDAPTPPAASESARATAGSGGNGGPPEADPADDDGDDADEDDTETNHHGDRTRSLVEWVVVIAGALVVALLIKTFLFQAFYIPSESMDPTLQVGDRVLVNKTSYDIHDVHRGDLIVFEKPESEGSGGVQDLIKRVIGLPGETVTARDNVLYIDGKPLDEPYLQDDVFTDQYEGQKIPEGHVFVMGDNRTDSRDSRFFGPIPIDDIVGRAFFRIWPPSDLGFL